jgi:hypothetical protein
MELKSLEREKKLRRKDFLEEIRKASNEKYETDWDGAGKIIKQKKKSKIQKGKKSRSAGGQFEARVRKDLEEKGWVVDKWSNNIDLEIGKMAPAKRKFNPFAKVMTIGTGFPDFIAFQKMGDHYNIIGVEVKVNGTLSKIEKEKCKWYLENKIFGEIQIAKKIKEKNRVRVEYTDVEEMLNRMR